MSNWISVASVIGALGLFLAGQHWVVVGLRASRPATWQTLSKALQRTAGRGTPYIAGLATAVAAPTNEWSSQITLGGVHRPGRALDLTVWQIIGSCMALAISAWCALGVQSGAGFLEPLAWTLIGVGGVLYSALPRARSTYWIALGAGASLLGLIHLEAGFAATAGVRLDSWGLAMPARVAVSTLLGIGATALLRSPGAVLVIGLFAADHGSIHVTTGLALFAGASIGSLSASLSAWRKGGDTQARRAAVAMAAFQGLVAILTVLSLALGLPLLGNPPQPFDQPIWLLTGWSTMLLISATLVSIPLVRPGIRFMESRLGLFDANAEAPPTFDRSMLTLPTLTLDCLRSELDAMRKISTSLARRVLGEERVSDFRTTRDIQSVSERAQIVIDATDSILDGHAPEELRRLCSWAPSAAAVYVQTCKQMEILRRPDLQPSVIPDSALRARVLQFRWGFLHFLEHACAPDTLPLQRDQERHHLDVQSTDLQGRLLFACSERSLEPLAAHAVLAGIDALRSMAHALSFALSQAEPKAEVEDTSAVADPAVAAAPQAQEQAPHDLDGPQAALPTNPAAAPTYASASVQAPAAHSSLFSHDQPS